MGRPEFVSDAIELDESGVSIGRYLDYTLYPACQPIYSIEEDGIARLVAYEGLIRPESNGYPVHPEFFFEQVPKRDKVFIESMCVALHIRSYRAFQPAEKFLFVNVNIANFQSLKKLETEFQITLDRLEANGLDQCYIVFEILEHEILSRRMLERVCEILRGNNVRFALDDYGKGCSNVERFLNVRPDIVKLDRTLFQNFSSNNQTFALLKSMVAAFTSSGSTVLMEGVETEEEVFLASKAGVKYLQGFYFSRPTLMPGDFARTIDLHSETLEESKKRAV